MNTDSNKYPVLNIVYKIVLAGKWVDGHKYINKVKEINGIIREASLFACYNQETNITILEIYITSKFGSEVY